MTKEAALLQYFKRFQIGAYPATAVPDDAELPYLTYEPVISNLDEGEVTIVVNLWYYTTDESQPNAKARELEIALGEGPKLPVDGGGYIWPKRGNPFCQHVKDDADPRIKRRYINITAEYLT